MVRRELCVIGNQLAEVGRVKISLCTITFRHQLISLGEIASFARTSGFDGIELWGAHARSLSTHKDKHADWLDDYGLTVPMISDYLPLKAMKKACVARRLSFACWHAVGKPARSGPLLAVRQASIRPPPSDNTLLPACAKSQPLWKATASIFWWKPIQTRWPIRHHPRSGSSRK